MADRVLSHVALGLFLGAVWGLCLYRVLAWDGLVLGDVREIVGQVHWALDYGMSHPPLPNWLFRLAARACGWDWVCADIAVHGIALSMTGALLWDAARRVWGHAAAAAALGGLLALRFVSVSLLVNGTHSPVVLTGAAMTVHALALLHDRAGAGTARSGAASAVPAWRFLWLGLGLAVAGLAKYNAVLLIVAVAFWALWLAPPALGRGVLRRALPLTALLLAGPYLVQALNPAETAARLDKLGRDGAVGLGTAGGLAGLGAMARVLAAEFGAPLVPVLAAVSTPALIAGLIPGLRHGRGMSLRARTASGGSVRPFARRPAHHPAHGPVPSPTGETAAPIRAGRWMGGFAGTLGAIAVLWLVGFALVVLALGADRIHARYLAPGLIGLALIPALMLAPGWLSGQTRAWAAGLGLLAGFAVWSVTVQGLERARLRPAPGLAALVLDLSPAAAAIEAVHGPAPRLEGPPRIAGELRRLMTPRAGARPPAGPRVAVSLHGLSHPGAQAPAPSSALSPLRVPLRVPLPILWPAPWPAPRPSTIPVPARASVPAGATCVPVTGRGAIPVRAQLCFAVPRRAATALQYRGSRLQ